MNPTVIIEPEAEDELLAAISWYEEHRPGLGKEFFRTVERAIDELKAPLDQSLPVPGLTSDIDARRVIVGKFPFAVVFLRLEREIEFFHHELIAPLSSIKARADRLEARVPAEARAIATEADYVMDVVDGTSIALHGRKLRVFAVDSWGTDLAETIASVFNYARARANADGAHPQGRRVSSGIHPQHTDTNCGGDRGRRQTPQLWEPEPELGRVANGIPGRVHRLKQLGNSIVPQVAARILYAIKEADDAS